MGYPYDDKTYLEKIQESQEECQRIDTTYWALVKKYLKENYKTDYIDLSIQEMFSLLGEAFELSSQVLENISDEYHFMWDVLGVLLTPKEKKDGKD